jgi:16S rRNA processing protein RimM
MSQAVGDKLFEVGRVVRAHGVLGEIKVAPEVDDPSVFEGFSEIYLGPGPNRAVPTPVVSVRFQPTQRGTLVILKLDGVGTREAAEALVKLNAYALDEALEPLAEDEFFLHDLPGLTVVAEDGARIGVVRDILELPAQPVLVVERAALPEVKIPLVPEFIVDIDFEGARIVVHVIEGLLE